MMNQNILIVLIVLANWKKMMKYVHVLNVVVYYIGMEIAGDVLIATIQKKIRIIYNILMRDRMNYKNKLSIYEDLL